jgi:chromosome segregation ATPase
MATLSETLQQRIEETRGEILALEARLVAVLEEKQATLGADKINVNTLATLEAEEVKIPATLASLHTRVSLLSEQIEQAEKEEAVARVAEIEHELAQISPR